MFNAKNANNRGDDDRSMCQESTIRDIRDINTNILNNDIHKNMSLEPIYLSLNPHVSSDNNLSIINQKNPNRVKQQLLSNNMYN